jgi:hypothetical protein
MMLNVKVDGDSLVGETAGYVNPLLTKEDYRRGQLYAILCPCKPGRRRAVPAEDEDMGSG